MREIEMASVLRRAGRATANSAHAPLLRAMATHGANLIVLPIARPASTPDNAPNFAATASCLREMAEHGNRHAPLGMVSAAPTRSARAMGSVPKMRSVLAMGKSPVMSHALRVPRALKVAVKAHVLKVDRAMERRIPSAVKHPAVNVLPATDRGLRANPAVRIRKADIT